MIQSKNYVEYKYYYKYSVEFRNEIMKWVRRSTINPLIAKLKWEWLITFNYIDELENKLKKYDQFKFEEIIKEICKNLAIKERKDV
ncbi:9888_t:CDS:1, partial [Dentiscutata erythropus]